MTQKFTTPCFIRKNTAELRKKLEELGYKQVENGVDEWHIPMSKLPYLETGYDGRVDNYFVGENGYWHTCAIDCGTNEDLFLALAALREDSDYMQFFTDGTEFILCDRYDWIDMYSVLCSGLSNAKYRVKELDKFQKATAEELIEHFKN